jgi:hypothetical protein
MPVQRAYPIQLRFWHVGLTLGLIVGCRTQKRPAVAGQSGDTTQTADSLVTSNANGVEIWFTLARAATGLDGKQCIERGLEIRRGGTRVQVPLLYTGDPPVLINDSTMRAVLWTHCAPVDTYLVDLRSGRPVRDRANNS